ncbi:sensor histidine kinase [Segetibacter koreensis]|uniref:sensor histidine kinase n=1 Tax=Segetibacter koreensis TaxID=398037 RepID=UPI000370B1BE|nr:PAS domain-containing sensor histidine kinase [Segetibacter koreensis]
MFNKLLNGLVPDFFAKYKRVAFGNLRFLKDVNNYHVGFQKARPLVRDVCDNEIQELKLKLRSEADDLKKAHNEFGRILNSVNHGFFSRNMIINNYTYLSLACEKIYGYTSEEFFKNSRLWYEVILPEDRGVVEKDDERLNEKEEVYTQYRIIRKDKSIRWIEVTIVPFFKDEKLIRVDGVVNDITERKRVEAEREMLLKEMTKNNADLKQFSYITSHNLRSPLSNIRGILSLFDFPQEDLHNLQMLEMLKVSVEQLNKTIDDISQILVIKNNVNPQLTSINLKEFFNQVIQIFSNALNEMGGEVLTDFKSPSVVLNKIYLESIFINLISNAIKYHSPDRKLIIIIESSYDENGNFKIRFSDNGTGIDLNRHKDKVFGLYQRFHENIEGQGLGLFIMKSQIEAIGGKIVIESEPGQGTHFFLTFIQ